MIINYKFCKFANEDFTINYKEMNYVWIMSVMYLMHNCETLYALYNFTCIENVKHLSIPVFNIIFAMKLYL